MATTLTPNLKLRVDSNLTANAKYNLTQIDLLGSTFLVDSTSTLNIRSQTGIIIDPNSPDLGGSGQGTVTIGDIARQLSALTIYADEIVLTGLLTSSEPIRTSSTLELDNGTYTTAFAPAESGQTENLTFKLPNNYGSEDQLLATDGEGNLTWVDSSGVGTVTSVDLAAPVEFIVSGNPVTTDGTLTLTKANQASNEVYAGPATGAAAEPTFRALVPDDIPTLPSTKVGLGNVPNVDATNPANIVQSSSYRFVTDTEKSSWNGKEDAANRDVPNGYAPLDGSALLPTANLPPITNSEISASANIDVSKLANGTEDYVLTVSSGIPSWQPVPVQAYKTDWITADGIVKTVVHNLGTTDVMIQLFDKSNGESIGIDTTVRTDNNTVVLTASETPGVSGWRILILAI